MSLDEATAGGQQRSGLFIDVSAVPRGVRLTIAGELGLATAPTLRLKLEEVSGWAEHVELDLSEVTFMDSWGLGTLIGCKYVEGRNHSVVIVAASPEVERVLHITRAEGLFRAHPNRSLVARRGGASA